MSVSELFDQDVRVINIGLETFAEDLKAAGVPCVHVASQETAGRTDGAPPSDSASGKATAAGGPATASERRET